MVRDQEKDLPSRTESFITSENFVYETNAGCVRDAGARNVPLLMRL
jgi:hypothetical protein